MMMKQCMEQCMRRDPPPYAEMTLPSYTSIDMEDEIDTDTPISQESVERQALVTIHDSLTIGALFHPLFAYH